MCASFILDKTNSQKRSFWNYIEIISPHKLKKLLLSNQQKTEMKFCKFHITKD